MRQIQDPITRTAKGNPSRGTSSFISAMDLSSDYGGSTSSINTPSDIIKALATNFAIEVFQPVVGILGSRNACVVQ